MLKRVRPIDAAILAVVAAIIVVACYLGYTMWADQNALRASSPATREIDAFMEHLRRTPNDIDARMRLAQALAVAGRDEESAQQYRLVLKMKKDFVPALSGLGFELMKQKDWKGGEPYFQRVITLTENITPSSATGGSPLEVANYYIGVGRMEQHDYAAAAGYLKRALQLRRDASDTSYALAVCYQHLGVKDDYREMLQYTLQFNPKMPEANYDYGLLLLSEGDIAGAAERFRISSDAAPYKPEPRAQLDKLGTASARLEDANKLASHDASAALTQARVAAALDSKSLDALALVGKLYEQLHKPTDATATYQKMLTIDPGNAIATAGLKRVKDGS